MRSLAWPNARRAARQDGWFEAKIYAHFDVPWTFERAQSYVTNPDCVRQHPFFPFLAFTKRQRRFKSIGIDPKERPLPRPLCNGEQFREIIRRGPFGSQKLIKVNQKPHGIPQGAQISAILSNISMLKFDSEMHAAAVRMGGSYRRYSDDILFIVNPEFSRPEVVAVVEAGLKSLGTAMKLNHDKTESAQFVRDANGKLCCDTASGIQYLGFTFDGERRMIRSQTISKYARRLVYAVRVATRAARVAGTPVYRRGIYRRFSHLGKSNFISGYVGKARKVMKSDAIRRQLRQHMRHIANQFDRT